MTASSVPQRAFLCRCRSPFPSWSFFEPLVVALMLLLLFAESDSCGPPPRFSTMKTDDIQESYSPGDEVVYKCRLGFRHILNLPLMTVCQEDNTWGFLQEACERKLCRHPAEPMNGMVNALNETFEFGSQIEYVCNEGFRLIGTKILHCEISGNTVEWSDSPPHCDKILCLPPARIENGHYTNSGKDTYEYNEVVTYSCNPVSSPDKYSLIGNSQLICTDTGEWSSSPPKCEVVKCVYPKVPNGKLTSGFGTTFLYKATVTFECEKNFNLQGSSRVTCEANSKWNPPLPECVPVSTTPVSTPSSTKTSTLPGSVPPSHKPPVSTEHPGVFPVPTEPPSSKPLGAGLIAVIVIIILVGITIIVILLYILLRKRKRGNREIKAEYTTCQNKSTTSGE
ncbi:membrane cofactor protein isoform X3 [Tamandua tetradactyla]|uniref:membrane cofactor protein isoform X3 n=1 Tax=Tamandua tetradactyla TaxID=48850 RepID=UPI0040538E6A